MGAPAATDDSQVVGVDIHIVLVPSPAGTVPTPLPHPFTGKITSGTVKTVKIGGKAVAVKDSKATNNPAHVATPPGTSFQNPPSDSGTVSVASTTVKAGGQGVARVGDQVKTCNDPSDSPVSAIVGPAGRVSIG